MKENIRVGFLTSQDPLNKKSWSGIHYRMYKGLSNEFDDVFCIGPIKKNLLIKIAIYIVDRIHLILFSKGYNRYHNIILSKYYGHKIKLKIRKEKIDVLFAPAGSAEIAFIKTNIPICYLSDTTFGQINNYYKSFSNLSNLSVKESNLIEQRAISNSTIQVFSSKWASDFVVKNYKSKKENVYTVNFGANIDEAPKLTDNDNKFLGSINFLFLGVDWERKGGDIVLHTFEILDNLGYDITLTICGCIPPLEITHPNIRVIPFLNKNIKKEYHDYLKIMHQTHLLFLPTRADCTPIVFCEANAFGIPVVTADTGGVTSIIKDGENGIVLPFESTPNDYAKKIQSLLDCTNEIKEMSLKSRIRYNKELNWGVWSKKMRELLLLTSHNLNNDLVRRV